jgi:glycosyltransferase involved in cell wall biosynthesis
MASKILVLGYFGYQNNKLDGQTIKTRNVYTLIKREHDNFHVSYFDTQCVDVKFWAIFKMFFKIIRSSTIIYLPAQRNLKLIFPIIFVLSKIFNIKINYIVVGGWLFEFLKNRRLYCFMMKRINSICVETDFLVNSLNLLLNREVLKIPNFRLHDFKRRPMKISSKKRLVFLARITPEKGTERVFQLCDFLIKKEIDFEFDFYGQISSKYEHTFLSKVEQYSCINYKGFLLPEDIYDTLCMYDVLVLPTSYEGEGFPGTILDAYIAGIPVVASNWKNIPEFIDEGQTGYCFELSDLNTFYNIVEKILSDEDLLNYLKSNAYLKSKDYSDSKALEIIKKII